MRAANALRSMQPLRRSLLAKGISKEISRISFQGNIRYNSTVNGKTESTEAAKSSDTSAADDDESKPPIKKVDYKTDFKVAKKYMDVNIMKIDGRVYESSSVLLSADTADMFPTIHGSNMFGVDKKIPLCSEADAKVVCFSVKEYGFQLVRDWMDPFARRYNPDRNLPTEDATPTENSGEHSSKQSREPASTETCSRVSCQEVIFVEHSLLWFARSSYATSSKPKLLTQQHEHTYLSFGSVTVRTCAVFIPYVLHIIELN